MKPILQYIRWGIARFIAQLIVVIHRRGKPAKFEAYGAISGTTFLPVPLLSHDDDPHWKIVRMPYNGGPALATIKPGYLVKFGATRVDVAGAVAADDAVLEGVIIDVGGTDPANSGDTTVAVALSGSFDKNTIKYADGGATISAAGTARLRDMGIFLDAAVVGGAFAP
jgi:hypothetical protein